MNKFQELMESVDILISRRLKGVTKVYYGLVKEVHDSSCTVTFKGQDYILKFYGNTPIVNHKYPIILPEGNLSQAFIIG